MYVLSVRENQFYILFLQLRDLVFWKKVSFISIIDTY